MKRVIITLLLTTLCACSSTPHEAEKGWIDNFVDTGEFNRKNITDGGIRYLGSVNEKYSNISPERVIEINDQLLHIVNLKYGRASVSSVSTFLSNS